LLFLNLKKMFSGFEAELPWFTQQVLKLSHIVQNDAWKMALALIVFTVGFKLLRKRSFKFRLRSSRWGLKFPIVGGVFSKAAIALAGHWSPASTLGFLY
jgi:type IV pilus assembly protein PilC